MSDGGCRLPSGLRPLLDDIIRAVLDHDDLVTVTGTTGTSQHIYRLVADILDTWLLDLHHRTAQRHSQQQQQQPSARETRHHQQQQE